MAFGDIGPNKAQEHAIEMYPEVLASLKAMDSLVEMLWDAVPWGETFNLDVAQLNKVPMECKATIAKAEKGGD